MPRKRKPPQRVQTRTVDAPEKYTAQDIFMGQVIALEDKFFVITVIGASWDNLTELLVPDHKKAVIAEMDNPDAYLNLKLHTTEE